jgi:anti-sigma B factor antagonist
MPHHEPSRRALIVGFVRSHEVAVINLSHAGHTMFTQDRPELGSLSRMASQKHSKRRTLSMEMAVTRLEDAVTCVRLSGRLDAPGADKIGVRFSASVAAGGRDAAVDLAGVSFVASMGIRLLISSARALNARGGRMVMFAPQELVRNVLEQAAIDQIIPIVPTEQAALDYLKA